MRITRLDEESLAIERAIREAEEREALELALAVLSGYIRRLPEGHRDEPQRSYNVLWKMWERSKPATEEPVDSNAEQS